MRYLFVFITILLVSCVDPIELRIVSTTDQIVVDGVLTNLPEPQIIRLNRSVADPFTGRFGTLPLTKATVQIVDDAKRVYGANETVDGSYQFPSDFKGEPGRSYQLRVVLSDGTRLESSAQKMPDVVPIQTTTARFSTTSLPSSRYGGYRAGHDVFVSTQDPANTKDFYRWDVITYEKQLWCRSCNQGVYAVYAIIPRRYALGNQYVSGTEVFEDCFSPRSYGTSDEPPIDRTDYTYDYHCRTNCWEIVRSYSLNLFSDVNSNGGAISQRKVGEVPYLAYGPCLAVVRQATLTADAFGFYRLLQEQSQNTGGVADTPPTALIGNIKVLDDKPVSVIGFFAATAVSEKRLWLDRKDTQGPPFGATDPTGPPQQEGEDLFYALNRRRLNPEPPPPYTGIRAAPKVLIFGGPPRVPTAVCVPSDTRTPIKPNGWRD